MQDSQVEWVAWFVGQRRWPGGKAVYLSAYPGACAELQRDKQ